MAIMVFFNSTEALRLDALGVLQRPLGCYQGVLPGGNATSAYGLHACSFGPLCGTG